MKSLYIVLESILLLYKILEKQIYMSCGSSSPKTKTKPKKGFLCGARLDCGPARSANWAQSYQPANKDGPWYHNKCVD